MPSEEDADEDYATSVEAYSHFREVSNEVHEMLNTAVRAYAHLNSKHSQNIGVTPQTAQSVKSAILAATLRLETELKLSRNSDDDLDKIAKRWFDGEEPWIQQLEDSNLSRNPPEFLGKMVRDVLKVGHSLGYMQSGRTNSVPKTQEAEDEKQVKDMFS